ncbi:hypothetical protein KUTeg_001878 [Tegillarca granosa]|uniref:Transmembrane protein 222 n=1 Tax=Tegillarca granosa TaxID=220873 RepID=A0ABQ9FVW7_TEGGR|nr:hypothetical protein KUTeg_001878 [Tegillarca granosa]
MDKMKTSPDPVYTEKTSIASMKGQLPYYSQIIDPDNSRFPHCIVWTPIPCLTLEDCMAFGRPTKYWQLDMSRVRDGKDAWDKAVHEASEEYKHRMHNLCCDNCHSHVAMALNLMHYNGSSAYNMVKLCFMMLIYGKYVSSMWLYKNMVTIPDNGWYYSGSCFGNIAEVTNTTGTNIVCFIYNKISVIL